MLVLELEKNLWNDRWWIKGGSLTFEGGQKSWWRVVHDIAHSKKYILFLGMWKLACFVQKQLCGNWCNEGYYNLNMIQDGNNEVGKPYWFFSNCSTLLQSYIFANHVQFSFSSLHLPSMSFFWSYECNLRTTLWFFGAGQGSLPWPLTIAKELLLRRFYEQKI
jgi:hypothetical protein